MGTLSGLFVHLNTLKEVGENTDKQMKRETEATTQELHHSRPNSDQSSWLFDQACHSVSSSLRLALMCPTKVEFLGSTFGCQYK